jgi:uncharacterized surface protein with fasciclin (FAS1) repeats
MDEQQLKKVKAFSRITKPVLDQFAVPLNYPLLLSLIRNHFVEGPTNQTLLPSLNQKKSVKSAEGYSISLSSTSEGTTIDNHSYSSKVNNTPTIASNGVLYKVDKLLDPFASAFGVSSTNHTGKATPLDQTPRQEDKTMTDLVIAEPQLSQWTKLMKEVLSAILKRLGDRRGAEGKDCPQPKPFAMIPTNEALAHLPVNYTNLLAAPFNFALSSHLLAWGISVPTCASFDDIMASVRTKGSFKIFSHRADINLTITESSKGSGELLVNNARVLMANRCAGNGCIWMVDRMIDPVYGLF